MCTFSYQGSKSTFSGNQNYAMKGKKRVEDWEKKMDFLKSSNPAALGQFLQPGAKLQPKMPRPCRRELANIEKRAREIRDEEDKVKNSYKDIIHSHTGEIHKYAAEQTFYNEQQIEVLQSLVAEHVGLKGSLCENMESVEKTFVALPKDRN